MDEDIISVADSAAAHPPPIPHPTPRENRSAKRVRVTRACDRCKGRKIRCTGLQPCRLCVETGSQCTYDAVYTRGKITSIHKSGTSCSSRQLSSPQGYSPASSRAQPAPRLKDALASQDANLTQLTPIESIPRASSEPVQTDLDGHYVGSSSGVSFLLKIQKRLDQFVSLPQGSSIFTFGDVPLPSPRSLQGDAPCFDPTFHLMLSKDNTQRLVQRYFDFAVPVDRFVHRPTIEAWLEEFYDSGGAMHNKPNSHARLALLFMIFALAQAHMDPSPTAAGADMSTRCFFAANQQLEREQGPLCLASVQARLCQCLWLLSESRINHCWTLFGTVARLTYAIGLHRKRNADYIDHIELECRRRTFWSAYALDNYLSAALGRPLTFHDEDIDQELPSCVDDSGIYVDHIVKDDSHGQAVMLGPVAYAKLSRILSTILRNVYSIKPSPQSSRHAFVTQYTEELRSWRAGISDFLDPPARAAPLIPIFQRQKNVLNLAYWHTIILMHRPFLLQKFTQLRNSTEPSQNDGWWSELQIEQSIHECVQAATNIVQMVDEMVQTRQLFRAFWFTSYFAFSAAVILYIYTIQKSKDAGETYWGYLNAAIRCQHQLSSLADAESLAARYCLVLEELRIEALRQTGQNSGPVSPAERPELSLSLGSADAFAATNERPMGTGLGLPDVGVAEVGGFDDVMPIECLPEMTSWAQFEELVSAA